MERFVLLVEFVNSPREIGWLVKEKIIDGVFAKMLVIRFLRWYICVVKLEKKRPE